MRSRLIQSLPATLVAIVCLWLTPFARTAAAAPAAAQVAGKTLLDPNLGFILELPAGFVPAPDVLARNPSMLYAYGLGRRDSNGVSTTLMIERLGKTLGRERLQRSQIPSDLSGEIITTQWKGFTLDTMILEKKIRHRTYLAYIVRIPLKREAIQLELVGPAARKDELDATLRQLLDGLQGESNWTANDPAAGTDIGAASAGLFAITPRNVIIGVAVLGILAFVPLLWPRRAERALLTPLHARSLVSSSSSSPSSTSPPPPISPTSRHGATPPPLPPPLPRY